MAAKLASQEHARTTLAKIIDNYSKTQGTIRPHCIISGSSGTGKSYLIEVIARSKGIGFVNVNAAQLTREGISGNSLSKALEPLKQFQNKPVIVFLDEFDKLFNGVNGGTGDERSGVQSEILHIISSGTAQLIGDYGHYVEINTHKMLFMFAGAFLGEQDLSPERLLKMGMFPELLGRVNLHVPIPDIPCEELIAAMKKEPLLQSYFNLHNVSDTDKQEEAIDAIADQIRKQYKTSVIGYRLITRLIHQYFIYDGAFPHYTSIAEAEALDEMDAQMEEEFEKQLSFGE